MKIDRSQIKRMISKIGMTPQKRIDFFYSNDNSDFCYLPIPKNAHTWGRTFFQKYAQFVPITNTDNKKFLVFLREPISRWISGVTQWFDMHHYGTEFYDIDKTTMDLIFTVIRLDLHTAPQTTFVSGIYLDKCIFFDIGDPLFETNLKYFLHTNNICRFSKISQNKINTTERSPFKTHIATQLQNAIDNNPEYKFRLYEYYECDLKLFEKIQFFNAQS